MKRWIIVNVSKVTETGWDEVIDAGHRPKYLHHDRDQAEAELLRLRQTYWDEFVLFESVAHAVPIGESGSHYQIEPVTA